MQNFFNSSWTHSNTLPGFPSTSGFATPMTSQRAAWPKTLGLPHQPSQRSRLYQTLHKHSLSQSYLNPPLFFLRLHKQPEHMHPSIPASFPLLLLLPFLSHFSDHLSSSHLDTGHHCHSYCTLNSNLRRCRWLKSSISSFFLIPHFPPPCSWIRIHILDLPWHHLFHIPRPQVRAGRLLFTDRGSGLAVQQLRILHIPHPLRISSHRTPAAIQQGNILGNIRPQAVLPPFRSIHPLRSFASGLSSKCRFLQPAHGSAPPGIYHPETSQPPSALFPKVWISEEDQSSTRAGERSVTTTTT